MKTQLHVYFVQVYKRIDFLKHDMFDRVLLITIACLMISCNDKSLADFFMQSLQLFHSKLPFETCKISYGESNLINLILVTFNRSLIISLFVWVREKGFLSNKNKERNWSSSNYPNSQLE